MQARLLPPQLSQYKLVRCQVPQTAHLNISKRFKGKPKRKSCTTTVYASYQQSQHDVVALGNLCVDIVLEQQTLPLPSETAARMQLLQGLSTEQHPKRSWEVGGNCNFMIAASRLGLKTTCIGHTGSDIYAQFLKDVLKEEGISMYVPIFEGGSISLDDALNQTLLCFVLVDPQSNHAFCSRYDFGPWPLLSSLVEVPAHVLEQISQSRSLFLNGFIFDELPPEFVQSAAQHAQDTGSAIFFDPGPRCWTLLEGERRLALDSVLDASDVVLMTSEEASAITGCEDAEQAVWKLINRPNSRIQWAVAKLGSDGAILANKNTGKIVHQDGLKVAVEDTVGCGDSFAAAIVLGFINQQPVDTTLALANAVGAATATGRGAGRNVAGPRLVLELLQYQIQNSSAQQQQKYTQAEQLLYKAPDLINYQKDQIQLV